MRTTAMWVLLGVFVLLGGQPSEAGTGDHAQRKPDADARAYDEYVAIGDSYTAGSGIPPGEEHGCWRSPRSYPRHLAARLDVKLVDASCGGATTLNAELEQRTDSGVHPPQLSYLDRDTDLVTVGLGFNDAGLGELLSTCAQAALVDREGTPCRQAYATPGGDAMLAGLPEVGRKLEYVLDQVQEAAPDAEVVAVGYPLLAPRDGRTCAELAVARGDYAYLNEVFLEVDSTLRAAARRAGVDYLSLVGPSEGHDICAGRDAWVVGGTDHPRGYVWHPFANEQRAVAGLLREALPEG